MVTSVPLVLVCDYVQRNQGVEFLVYGRSLQWSKVDCRIVINWLFSHIGHKWPACIKFRHSKSTMQVSRWSGTSQTIGRQVVEERVETGRPVPL